MRGPRDRDCREYLLLENPWLQLQDRPDVTATDSTFVRSNTLTGIDAAEVQDGGSQPPFSLCFGRAYSSSTAVVNL